MKADQHKEAILKDHRAGMSVESLHKKYGIHQATVRTALKRWGETIVNHSGVNGHNKKEKSIVDPKAGVHPEQVRNCKRFVVTSALNNCDVNSSFLKSIQTYCKEHQAELLVIPVAYKNISLYGAEYEPVWPSELDSYYVTGDVELSSNLVLMGSMRIQATAARPLQGTQGISKGRSAVFGHPRLALEMVPVPMNKIPLVYMTSGTVSKPSYSNTKAGRLGEFHHDIGATIIETDGELFWWRHIHPDKFGSFIDISTQYGPDGSVFPAPPAEAVIVGDIHVGFDNPDTVDSVLGRLVGKTSAKNVILHDLLDFFSGSHHHMSNSVLRVLKSARGRNDVHRELASVATWLDKYCKEGTQYHIIRSNHHDHLDKWLNNNSANIEAENLWLWHHLNAQQMRIALDMANDPAKASRWGVPSAFELAMSVLTGEKTRERFRFQDDKSPLEFFEIDCSNHGDKGPNGSRGSRAGFSRVQRKTFIGHSHSPGIHDGCYQVGKSAVNEAYLSGYSSHLQCSGIIYADGNRSLLPVIDGKTYMGDI